MSSNYPPGVTGNEYEIAGPDYEVERVLECPHCDLSAVQIVQGYRGQEWYECSQCGEHVDIDMDVEFEPDLEGT